MSQALTMFQANALPAHIADMFADEDNSNIQDRVSVPSLSPEGKTWTISLDGTKTKITRRNADGDDEPVTTMRVVVLAFAPSRGRAYYPGAYDPTKPGVPECWSDDGVAPPPQVSAPKSAKCADCPLSIKGSKVTDQGNSVTACSQHLMLAVVPANKLEFSALRLKLAITSVWDKRSPDLEKLNWFAFDNYKEFLRTNKVMHTGAIVTKMRFDPNTPYPKVIFSNDRWLTAEELEVVKPRFKSDEVTALISGTWTPAGVDGKRLTAPADDDDAPAPPPPNVAPPVVVKPARAVKPATFKVPEPVVTAPPVAQVTILGPDDDDDGDVAMPTAVTPPAKAAAAAPAAPAKVSTAVPDDLADLLKEWDPD